MLTRAQVKALLKRPQLGLSKQQQTAGAAAVPYDGGAVSAEVLSEQLYGLLERVVMQALLSQNLGEVGTELTRICEFSDKENCGFLDARQLKQVLLQGFPFLTRLQANALVSDKDVPTDVNGRIAWREYLPKLTSIIKGMGDFEAIRERDVMMARAEFQPVELMGGKDHEAMSTLLANLFEEADADKSGKLDHNEFRACMAKADLGLGHADIDDLIYEFDTDGDGSISYEEFTTLAYGLLVHLARERAIMNAMVQIEPEVFM